MFNTMPNGIQSTMKRLEEIDRRDRLDGTPRLQRLRQIPPETGRFLAILAANAPDGECIEIGTSAGYSALWLALACRATGRRLTTFEVLEEKVYMAKETFREAGVEDVVTLIHGDARHFLRDYARVAFCFLDAEKEAYSECYELVVPNMVSGAILAADNVISHQADLACVVRGAAADGRVDSVVAPIGKGVLICRKA